MLYCNFVKQLLNTSILNGHYSIILAKSTITALALEELKECSLVIKEKGDNYIISY